MKNRLPFFIRKFAIIGLLLTTAFALLSGRTRPDIKRPIVWKLGDTTLVGGYSPAVLGKPHLVHDGTNVALFFNGVNDGLVIPAIPISGWKKFTIEMLFKPASDGPVAPRFFHCQDSIGNRCTIELRITPKKQWYLDTFLKNGKTNKSLALIDSTMLHSCDQWYWVALTYDGKKMTHYVNAVKEKAGDVDFVPMTNGQTSIGVRLNKVDWFKGLIQEVRFHPDVLKPKRLQQLK